MNFKLRHCLSAALVLCCVVVAPGLGQYFEATIPCPCGDEGILWNPLSNKVYVVTAIGGNFVTIIDGATNQVLSQIIDVPEYPIRLAQNTRQNKVYTSCTESSCLLVIDGVGDTLIRTVRVTEGPMAMAYNAAMNQLYVCGLDADCISVLDAGPDTVVKTIRLGSPPLCIMWHPVTNLVFCATSWGGEDTLFVIDCTTDEIVGISTGIREPQSVVLNLANNLVYVIGHQMVWVMSSDGDSVVARIPTTRWSPIASCFSRVMDKLYIDDFNPPALVTVIDCRTNTVVDSFQLGGGNSLGMTADTIQQKLYCGARYGQEIWFFDMRTDTFIKSLGTGSGREFVEFAWNWTNSRVYATDGMNQVVHVLRDTSSAIGDAALWDTGLRTSAATVVRARIYIRGVGPTELLDLSGRLVARLRPGWNDMSCFPVGVYFLREREGALVSKVIIQR